MSLDERGQIVANHIAGIQVSGILRAVADRRVIENECEQDSDAQVVVCGDQSANGREPTGSRIRKPSRHTGVAWDSDGICQGGIRRGRLRQ